MVGVIIHWHRRISLLKEWPWHSAKTCNGLTDLTNSKICAPPCHQKLHSVFCCSIAKILEAGLMTRWKQIYWLPEDACSVLGGVGSGSTTVKVTDMQSSFYILGLGNLLQQHNIISLPIIFFYRFCSGRSHIHDRERLAQVQGIPRSLGCQTFLSINVCKSMSSSNEMHCSLCET